MQCARCGADIESHPLDGSFFFYDVEGTVGDAFHDHKPEIPNLSDPRAVERWLA